MKRLTEAKVQFNHTGKLTPAKTIAVTDYATIASNGADTPLPLDKARGSEAVITVGDGEYIALGLDATEALTEHQVGHAMIGGQPGVDLVLSTTEGNFEKPTDVAFAKFDTHNDDGTRSALTFVAKKNDISTAKAGLTPGRWYLNARRTDGKAGPIALRF